MLLAFVPGFAFPDGSGGGFTQAPGLILFLITLALVLDANVAILGLTLLIGKLVSIPLLSVSYSVGETLLGTGPDGGLLSGPFRWLINSPATAWFGFQYYSVTGGVALGLILGLLFGFGWWRAIDGTRRKLADLDENSDRWREITSKPLVRLVTWALLGKGKGKKKSWDEINERARARKRPVRLTGFLAVVVLFAGLGFAHNYFGGTWFERTARVGMTQWNGATADLGRARLDLIDGHLTMSDLALADERDLETDTFRAKNLDFDLSTGSLLERRVVIERLAVTEAESGSRRETPGARLGSEDESGGAGGPGGPAPDPVPEGEEKSTRGLEELLDDVEIWRERLETAEVWIDRLFSDSEPASETEREASADLYGLATIVAEHLLDKEPTVLIQDLRIEDFTARAFGGIRWDLTGSNLSSNPALVGEPARLAITSEDGHNAIRLERGADGLIGIACDFRELPLAMLKEQMPWLPLEGGLIDFSLDGSLGVTEEGFRLDLPLGIEVRNTTMTLGSTSAQFESLRIPAEVHGPLTALSFHVNSDELLRRLQDAGAQALVQGLASEFGVAPDSLQQILEGGLLEGELDADALQNAGENLLEESGLLNEAENATEEAANRLRGLLPGGGRRRD